MPAACSAVRTATRSVASETTSKASPRSLTSSAPASRVASRTSSSVTCLPSCSTGHDHDALAVEQVRHRARVGQRAAVAGHRGADLHGGAVAVVGEALDEHRDAVRAVALVHDRLVVGAAGLGAGAALDRAVDVVVGDRGLLGLLDGVVERRVAGRVAAAHPGRDLDVLDQLGEHLAALGVDDGLLVLGGRPLGVAGHASPSVELSTCSAARPGPRSSRWIRASPPTSGWNDVAISVALPDRDDPTRRPGPRPRGRAPRRPAPTSSTHGARMKTRVHRAGRGPSTSRSASKESTWRPNALRRTVMSRPPRVSWPGAPSRDPVGQQDHPGAGAERRHARRAIRSPQRLEQLEGAGQLGHRGRLAAGEHQAVARPSSSAGRRTGDGVGRRARPAARRCSRTSPCRARTPIGGPRPAAHQPRSASRCGSRDLVDVDADHGLAEAAGDLGDHVGVVVEGGGLDDRLGALRRVAGLEDARADEDALGAELHHHRGVGRGGDAAGGEQHDRQLAGLGDLLDQVVRRLQLLGRDVQLVVAPARCSRRISRADRAHVGDGVGDVAGAGLALGADHRRALGDPAQRLAEVGRAADERHGERPLVDVVGVVGRGEHLGLVDVVDAEALQHLRLGEVADPGLGHHRDRDRLDDAVDHVGVAHPGHAALGADVGGHPLERHHGDRAGVLGDLGLLGGDDVHDHAALEHLGHAALDAGGAGAGSP